MSLAFSFFCYRPSNTRDSRLRYRIDRLIPPVISVMRASPGARGGGGVGGVSAGLCETLHAPMCVFGVKRIGARNSRSRAAEQARERASERERDTHFAAQH